MKKIISNILLSVLLAGGWNSYAGSQDTISSEVDRLVGVLNSNADIKAKSDACRELGRIGTKDVVGRISPLLDDPKTSDIARTALEPMPFKEVDEVFRAALSRLNGNQLVGVLGSIGVRRDKKAATVLGTQLLYSQDMEVAKAAARALGSIGTPQAAAMLKPVLATADPRVRLAFAEGLLRCADHLAVEGERAEALVIYDQLRGAGDLPQVQAGAVCALIVYGGGTGVSLMIESLREGEAPAFNGALRAAMDVPGSAVTRALARSLESFPAERQVAVVRALGFRGDPGAAAALHGLARAGKGSAQLAAIDALTQLGNSKSVSILVELLKSSDPAVAAAAQKSLGAFPGKAADQAALKLLGSLENRERLLGLELVARRRMTSAMPELLRAAHSSDKSLKVAATRQLGELGGTGDVGAVLPLLASAGSAEELEAVQFALESIAERTSDKEAFANQLTKDWAKSPDSQKAVLLRVLGTTGGASALAAVRRAMVNDGPAVRADAIRVLSNWSSPDAAPDLSQLARNSENKTERALALRGYLRLARQGEVRPGEKLKMCRQVQDLVQTTEEKRLLLSAIGSAQNLDSITMLEPYLETAETRDEAAAAILATAERILRRAKEQAERAKLVPHLEKLLQAGLGEELSKRAKAALAQAQK